MNGRCDICGQTRSLKPGQPINVCYGCWPTYHRTQAAKRHAADERDHARKVAMADHPASGDVRPPDLRAVGTPQGSATDEPPARVVIHRGDCGDPDCSDCENIRRAELMLVLGGDARTYGLTPKYVTGEVD